MNKEELIKALEYTKKKHQDDVVDTFDTNISAMCSDVLSVLKNCIEIPDGATNGDSIIAMFPNLKIEYTEVDEYTNKPKYVKLINKDTIITKISADIWNSPFKTDELVKFDKEVQHD